MTPIRGQHPVVDAADFDGELRLREIRGATGTSSESASETATGSQEEPQ
jgi:hypothetical protein